MHRYSKREPADIVQLPVWVIVVDQSGHGLFPLGGSPPTAYLTTHIGTVQLPVWAIVVDQLGHLLGGSPPTAYT